MKLLPPVARSGALTTNVVHCCDALALLRALPDASVDMALTSPPYDNLRTYNGYQWDFEGIAQQSYRVLKPGGVLVWIVGDSVVNGSETLNCFKQAIYFRETVGFWMHDTMIYEKDGLPFPDVSRYYQAWEFMFVLSKGAPKTVNLLKTHSIHVGRNSSSSQRNADGSMTAMKYKMGHSHRTLTNIWKFGTGYMKTTKDKTAYQHPAMFPEKLAERHILTWSNPGDIVLDYFMGSGTTAKMARMNNRRYIGCDISAEYVDVARKRLAMPYTRNMFEVEEASA